MSFRNIRPSTQGTNNSASGSTGSDVAKKTHGESSSSSSGTSKKRRVPENVTCNACMNCKKARAKCDGKRPCGRCFQRVESGLCSYEIHIKHAKEELVRRINLLQEKETATQQILRALSNDRHVPEILQRLQNGESQTKIAEWLAPMEPLRGQSPADSTAELSDQEMAGISSTFSWTTVTSDPAILDHLFQLYFAWVHPVHTLFSEGHFVDSFRTQSHTFCSSFLVNAMCALACHLHSGSDAEDIEQLCLDFSDAAHSEMRAQSRSVTTVQAFAVMFLVDCARGRSLRAASYLRIANSTLSNVALMNDEAFPEVLRSTSRGIRCVNIEWAQMTFQVAPSLKPVETEPPQENDDEWDEAQWYFYRYMNDQCPSWPGLVATTNREKRKLLDIVNDVTTMYYSNAGPSIKAHHILQHYARYVKWREDLPKSIGDIDNNNHETLPHVLSLLILYSNSVVQLLRPLVELKGLNHAAIDEVIWKHAQIGLYLLDDHYRAQYTCRYQLVPQMFAVLHLCDVVARFFPERRLNTLGKDGAEAVKFGLEVFMQAYEGFPVAGVFQELLRLSALDCSVLLPNNVADLMTPARTSKQVYRVDDFIEACTRPSYLLPLDEILARFDPNFATEWDAQSPSQGFKLLDVGRSSLRRSDVEEQAAENLMQISSLLNSN